ncbi:MAG: MATE family efflux transporter [Armatimonadota bacterium]|nr:MATE family efflux transporter [Armatimonadota bacterium]
MTSRDPNHAQDELVTAITEGSVWHVVWRLSWPTMISLFLSTAQLWINTIFVGKLGKEAIAAVGLGGNALMVIFSLTIGITAGGTALVARFTGARSYDEAADAAKQAIILSLLSSIVVTMVCMPLAKPVIEWMGARGIVADLGAVYTVLGVISTTPYFLWLVLSAVFRGIGDMRTPLYIAGVVIALNIVGDWVLIFGKGPFPKLGVPGAAWALMISRAAGTALSFWWLLRSTMRRSLAPPWTPRLDWFLRIARIGVPAVIQSLLFSLAFVGFFWALGKLPNVVDAQAALVIGLRAEAIAFMPGFAFMTAATSLVGQNLGAQRLDRAERGAWICAWQSLAVMSVFTVVYFVLAEPFSRLFTNDPQVIALSVSYLRINAISEPFLGFAMVFTGAMQGAGDTRDPTIVAFLTLWIIRLPLTYIAAIVFHGGATAAWIIMSGTTILRGIIMIGLFKLGKWKTVQV